MNERPVIHEGYVDESLLVITAAMTLIYLTWWFKLGNADNLVLYLLLFVGEIFHVFLLYVLLNTIWPRKPPKVNAQFDPTYTPSVDIFIPVVSEPLDIIEMTVKAAKNQDYPNVKVYIANDGFVAKYPNWHDVEVLAEKLGVTCITRREPGGNKAGNINNSLNQTNGEIVVIFDADMVAYPDFLRKTIWYFQDPKIAFVQTPQFYKNYQLNEVAQAAWDQQEFFYGPIMIGKNNTNSSFICGTNVAIRRKALMEVGGLNTGTITEDVLTSLYIHQKGWKSVYIPEVLSEGLAPEDLLSYYKQQLRWARGGLDLFFKHNPMFKKGLTSAQRFEYFSSALYYASTVAILIDIIMPILYLGFHLLPVKIATTTFSLYFLPYIFLVLLTMYRVSDGSITFRAFSFSFSSFTIQLNALISILTGRKMGFVVTPKKGEKGDYRFLARPHLLYILVFGVATIIAILREGLTAAVAINVAWALFDITLFIPYIRTAYQTS